MTLAARLRALKEDPMPWQEESTMELRRQFIQDVQSGATSVAELCAAYRHQPQDRLQVARPLRDRWATPPWAISRAARTFADRDAARARRGPPGRPRPPPTWGPRKLLRLLRQQLPTAPWPARSTLALLLKRAGLVLPPVGCAGRASRAPAGCHGRAQCGLDRRLQRAVQDSATGNTAIHSRSPTGSVGCCSAVAR